MLRPLDPTKCAEKITSLGLVCIPCYAEKLVLGRNIQMLWFIQVPANANNLANKYSVIAGLKLIYYQTLECYCSAINGRNLNNPENRPILVLRALFYHHLDPILYRKSRQLQPVLR